MATGQHESSFLILKPGVQKVFCCGREVLVLWQLLENGDPLEQQVPSFLENHLMRCF